MNAMDSAIKEHIYSDNSVTAGKKYLAPVLMRLRPALLASWIKKAVGWKRQEITTPDGTFFVDIASNLGYPLLTGGIYEAQMIEVLRGVLRPGGVFVDLGANEGYFSVIAAKTVGESGKVIAIEPQARLQSVIQRNVILNGCKNIVLLPVAVSDKSEVLTLYLTPDMNTGSTAAIQTTRYPLLKQTVPSITLAELFEQQGLSSCDLLKIDIEGHEYEAIMGSREIFTSQRVKAIALELHPHILAKRNRSADKLTSFLFDCGYRLEPSFANTVYVSGK